MGKRTAPCEANPFGTRHSFDNVLFAPADQEPVCLWCGKTPEQVKAAPL